MQNLQTELCIQVRSCVSANRMLGKLIHYYTSIPEFSCCQVPSIQMQTMLTQQLLDELALVDVQADKLKGEMMDLQVSIL